MEIPKMIEDAIAHQEWTLSLRPGDKVLTNYKECQPNEEIPEYLWDIEGGLVWQEVTVSKVQKSDQCVSGLSVNFQECPQTWEYEFDSCWIKPLEGTEK